MWPVNEAGGPNEKTRRIHPLFTPAVRDPVRGDDVPRLRMGDRQEWAGGYKRRDGSAWTYYLRRRDPRLGRDPDGRAKRREVCTGAHSEEVARLHLAAFEKNPLAYKPARVVVGRGPLPFTEALSIEYLQYLDAP